MESVRMTGAPSPRSTMILCFLVSVLEGYDLQVISSAGPHLAKAMQLSPDKIGWFFSASLIGLAIGAIVGGWLADRIGRKPALIYSVMALGVFTFATAYAASFEVLLAIRVLAGIGLGGAMPTLIALIAEVSGGKNTTSAVTTIICGQPTGGVISALVGRTVAEQFGWPSLFIVGGILTLVIVPLLFRGLPETRPASPALGSTSVARMPAGEALFGGGRASSTLLLWTSFILTLALLSILLSWTPLLLIGKGFPRPVGLNAIIAINLGGIVGGLVISRMIDRYGVRWPMISLYLLMTVSLYFFAQAMGFASVMIFAALVGFAVLGAQFTLYGVTPQLYPLAGRGSGVGIAVAMGRIGSILGPVVIGRILTGGSSEYEAVLVMVPIALIAGAAIFGLTRVAFAPTRSEHPATT